MKKSFIFATMAAAALFAGCSSNDDLTSNPGGDVINPNTEQVAIKIGVAQAVSTGMRGTGTVGGVADIANGTDGYTAGADNIWAGQLINVYMFEKVTDANQKLTLAKEGQNSLYENTAMYTPGSEANKIPDMGAEAFTNFGEAMITDGKIQYWPLNGNYDFFGYHGDDAVTAVNPVQDGDIVTAYKANKLAQEDYSLQKQAAEQEADQYIREQLSNNQGYGDLLSTGLGIVGNFLSKKNNNSSSNQAKPNYSSSNQTNYSNNYTFKLSSFWDNPTLQQ